MPNKRAHVKNEKQYEALKDKGMSKERAAKIANSPGASTQAARSPVPAAIVARAERRRRRRPRDARAAGRQRENAEPVDPGRRGDELGGVRMPPICRHARGQCSGAITHGSALLRLELVLARDHRIPRRRGSRRSGDASGRLRRDASRHRACLADGDGLRARRAPLRRRAGRAPARDQERRAAGDAVPHA